MNRSSYDSHAKKTEGELSASARIDQHIAGLLDWQANTLTELRKLIHLALPEVIEEVKWGDLRTVGCAEVSRGMTPVWSLDGIICTGESYKKVVKLSFAQGATLADPAQLFNSSLEGKLRRAIDISAGQTLNAQAFIELIQTAAAHNRAHKAVKKPAKAKR